VLESKDRRSAQKRVARVAQTAIMVDNWKLSYVVMTTVHRVFTIRSFRSAKDRDFLKALQIYDANTHPQVKTDSREIAYWLDHSIRSDARFFVCGLFVSGNLVGFVEFVYLRKERLIHFDYFVIEQEQRTAGAFHTFAEEMRAFFAEEKLEWDFVTGEIADIDTSNGVSRHSKRLIRLFRQIGFYEVLADYEQPLLGVEHKDTAIKSTLLILPRVEMDTISSSRFLELVSAIYHKHYAEWYSIYPETTAHYRQHINSLFSKLKTSVAGKSEIHLRGPDREFSNGSTESAPPLRDALIYLAKIAASAVAVALFHILLRHKLASSAAWIFGITLSVFILIAVTISLTDKKKFEAFKLLVSLLSKFFDR
jgi:hypothetical protein